MRDVNVALLGVGIVGSGVVRILTENAKIIEKRLGFKLVLKRVFSKEVHESVREIVEPLLVSSYRELFAEDIDIVVELIGGMDFALDFILEAIRRGKSVVTANKALLANHGFDVFKEAFENKVDVGYEASVAGGIPIIKAVKESLSANHIRSIRAIVNGTCNYVLTKMLEENMEFDEALKLAQRNGFAETDPSFDVDGVDSAHKMAILSSISFGCDIRQRDVYVEGIRDITRLDIRFADELGYRIKLLGITNYTDDGVDVRVHPAMVKKGTLLAKIDGVYNGIEVYTDMGDDTVYIGKGAGSLPTASSVVADIMDIARNIQFNSHLRIPLASFPFNYVRRRKIVDVNDLEMSFYLRFNVEDSAGVLSKIAGVLGKYGISIRSVIQIGRGDDYVPLIVMTYKARQSRVSKALNEIERLPIIKSKTLLLRVEDE